MGSTSAGIVNSTFLSGMASDRHVRGRRCARSSVCDQRVARSSTVGPTGGSSAVPCHWQPPCRHSRPGSRPKQDVIQLRIAEERAADEYRGRFGRIPRARSDAPRPTQRWSKGLARSCPASRSPITSNDGLGVTAGGRSGGARRRVSRARLRRSGAAGAAVAVPPDWHAPQRASPRRGVPRPALPADETSAPCRSSM